MTNTSGLPPAALAAAQMKAQLQDVAVRLITLPDSLQNNSQPVKLSGTVKGQTPDGMVQVETERGVINILLKDRGNLPQGQRIEIEIPAGRPPQQAAIRPAPAATPTSAQPSLASHIQNAATAATGPQIAATANSILKLDRNQTVNAEDLAEALASAKPSLEIATAAPLQVGQTLRLIPISMMPQASGSLPNSAIFSPEDLFTSLMSMVAQAPDMPDKTKQSLIQILSRIDVSTLVPATGENASLPQQETLEVAFQNLVQELDLPETIKLQNAALQNTPTTIFNSAKPLDVKILAFQNTSFQAVLNQANLPGEIPNSIPLAAGNFSVLPQPVPVAPPVIAPPPVDGEVALPVSAAPAAPQNVPAQTPVLPPASSSAPPSFLGQVTGFTPQGQPILSLALPGTTTPQNYMIQFLANNIVEGSPVIVSPLPATTPIPQTPGLVPFPIGANQSLADWVQPEIWDSLQTLIGAVGHINPGMAQAMTQMLPNAAAPHNMGALSMFFLSVMRTGDLETWIGQPAINLLRQSGKIDILRQLAGETIVSNRLEATQLPNDWRAAIFPFWHDQQVHKLPLYYKQWNDEDDKDAERERKKKLRFMFELKLSRMGPVQVDGFMQKEKLDMILRTKSIIGPNMQDALRKTYHKAMERSNLSGEITFQFKPEQWVHVDMPMETA